MKDEYNGRPILEFVGLRPKMYSILEVSGKEQKKAKGINKRVTARMRHEQFKEALFEEKRSSVILNRIGSKNHDLFTMEITKLGLSCYEDKRYVLNDKITTLAYGHCQIVNST